MASSPGDHGGEFWPYMESELTSLVLRPLRLRERRMKKMAARRSPKPRPKPTTRPVMSPTCEFDLEALLAGDTVALPPAVTVTFCHLVRSKLLSSKVKSILTLALGVSRAKPSIGWAYACPVVVKSITPLELLLSYWVTV